MQAYGVGRAGSNLMPMADVPKSHTSHITCITCANVPNVPQTVDKQNLKQKHKMKKYELKNQLGSIGRWQVENEENQLNIGTKMISYNLSTRALPLHRDSLMAEMPTVLMAPGLATLATAVTAQTNVERFEDLERRNLICSGSLNRSIPLFNHPLAFRSLLRSLRYIRYNY